MPTGWAAAAWGGATGQRRSTRPRQRGIARGDLRHRHVDHLAAAAAQRLPHRARRLQSAQRVGDRVAAEHRPVGRRTDQPARDRGVVSESRTVRLAAITVDAQPDSSRPAGHVVGAQLAPPQRRGTRALDDDVGSGLAAGAARRCHHRNRLRRRAFRSSSSRRRRASPLRVPSGRRRAFHLDDDGARAGEQLRAQRPRPQRRQVGHQQVRPAARGRTALPDPAHRRWLCAGFRPARPRRCRAAGRGPPRPRSNTLPPNQKAPATGRREPCRFPAAPAAPRRHLRAAARPHTSRPQWPAVGWRRPRETRPRRVRPRIAARPANMVAASTSTPNSWAISAATRRASASTAAREKSGVSVARAGQIRQPAAGPVRRTVSTPTIVRAPPVSGSELQRGETPVQHLPRLGSCLGDRVDQRPQAQHSAVCRSARRTRCAARCRGCRPRKPGRCGRRTASPAPSRGWATTELACASASPMVCPP